MRFSKPSFFRIPLSGDWADTKMSSLQILPAPWGCNGSAGVPNLRRLCKPEFFPVSLWGRGAVQELHFCPQFLLGTLVSPSQETQDVLILHASLPTLLRAEYPDVEKPTGGTKMI